MIFSMSVPSTPPSGGGVRYVEVGPESAGQRLDNFLLARLKGVPRSHIYRLLRKGEVRVNKGRARPETRLEEGDSVRIPPVRTAQSIAPAVEADRFAWLEERVLHEDEHLMVIDKPARLAVHGGSGVAVGLIEALRAIRPHSPYLELAHRLDRETSGCLLIAKRRASLLGLHEMLRGEGVDKRYLALLQGRWAGGTRTIEAGLDKGRRQAGERRVAVDEEGKESASRFHPKRRFASVTLVEVELLTGRMHQARVHAVHAGHPIAGDSKYGDRDFNATMKKLGLKRLFLHAASLRLRHPVTNQKLFFQSPLPAELQDVLDRLESGERSSH
jgi:23S rRNA pseudouridine955/2504/2580 synthase